MRTHRSLIGALVALLVLTLAPAASAAPRTVVSTAEELQAALDAAAVTAGADTIIIRGRITLEDPAIFDGDGALRLLGGRLVGDADSDVLDITTDSRIDVVGTRISGGDTGLSITTADDAHGTVRVTLAAVAVTGAAGDGIAVTDATSASLRLSLTGVRATGNGGAGLAVQELGGGVADGTVRGSRFSDNVGPGIELVSLDVSAEEYAELVASGVPLPSDGETGALRLRGVRFAGNGGGAVDTDGVAVSGSGRDVPAFPAYTLTILHNNDGESDLLPAEADAESGIEEGEGSISRFGGLLIDQRKLFEAGDDAGAIAITAGDNFLAGPEFQASLDKGVPFYDSIALDYLDYDAYTIGNHEFDFGTGVLADFISGIEGCEEDPFLSANLNFDAVPKLAALEDRGCIQDSTIIARDGRQIGVIGLTTPDLREVSSPGDVEILANLAEIANAEAEALTAQGVDIVILASHLQNLDNEVALAAELTNIDAIVGGGGGEELAEARTATTADGVEVPIVTVPGDYFDLGRLVLEFDPDGTLLDFSWDLLPVGAALEQDTFLLDEVEAPIEDHLVELDQTIVRDSPVALNGVREDVRTQETNLGNLLADSFVATAQARADEFGVDLSGPTVGLQNGGGIRNDSVIPAGPVSVLDTFDIAPFDNFVAVVEDVSPEDLVAAVEHGLEALPGAEGFFAQWSGLVVTYDVAQPAGSRIVDLTVNGTPYVVDGVLQAGLEPVDVATINFLAAGNDGYDMFEAYDFTSVETSYQQSLADHLAAANLTAPEYAEGTQVRIIPAP